MDNLKKEDKREEGKNVCVGTGRPHWDSCMPGHNNFCDCQHHEEGGHNPVVNPSESIPPSIYFYPLGLTSNLSFALSNL